MSEKQHLRAEVARVIVAHMADNREPFDFYTVRRHLNRFLNSPRRLRDEVMRETCEFLGYGWAVPETEFDDEFVSPRFS